VTVITIAIIVWQLRSARPLSAPARIVCLIAIGITAGATILFAYHWVIALLPVPDDLRQRLWSFAVLLAVVALAAAQWRTMHERHGSARRWLAPASAALVVIGLLGWDVRTPWARMVEAQGPALAALLPQHGSIYWERGVDLLWFGMMRPSYFSCAQGGGAVFFRDAAFEFRRRAESFAQLHTVDCDEPDCRGFARENRSRRTRQALQAVCQQEPGLDFLVLIREVEGVEAKILRLPAPRRSVRGVDGKAVVEETDRFYLYSCADMRSGDRTSAATVFQRSSAQQKTEP
jgi:hypothetical protein